MLPNGLLSLKNAFKVLIDFGNDSTRLLRILYWVIIVAVVVGIWIFIDYKKFMKKLDRDLDREFDRIENKDKLASLNKDDDDKND